MPGVEDLVAAVFDTHAWVWCVAGHPRAQALKPFVGRAVVPAISAWEVAMLERKGRIRLRPDVETWIRTNLEPPVSLEPLSPQIAIESVRLPGFHGDPADRIIVATAIVLGLPLVSADATIGDWNRRHRRVQLVAF